jgi:hypothetical protein
MMVFADGENLMFRFQDVCRRGFVPCDDLVHEPEVYVWTAGFTQLGIKHEIL